MGPFSVVRLGPPWSVQSKGLDGNNNGRDNSNKCLMDALVRPCKKGDAV
jgi:hypothetical protein